ncbi:hypothetical protein K439DRAFT_770283 [Ramaria rubella]|nr:hypothetical protein K439DRAFT_770283 [Ramaria rubella]
MRGVHDNKATMGDATHVDPHGSPLAFVPGATCALTSWKPTPTKKLFNDGTLSPQGPPKVALALQKNDSTRDPHGYYTSNTNVCHVPTHLLSANTRWIVSQGSHGPVQMSVVDLFPAGCLDTAAFQSQIPHQLPHERWGSTYRDLGLVEVSI